MATQTVGDRQVQVVKSAQFGRYDYDVYGPVPSPGEQTHELIGHVRKRVESYSGLRSRNGRGGGRFTYWDAVGADGRRVGTLCLHAGECGGEAVEETNSRGFRQNRCLACRRWLSWDRREKDHYRREDNRFNESVGRDGKTGASTRRDAVAALVHAWDMEKTTRAASAAESR